MKIKHIRGSTKKNNFYVGPDRTLSVDLDTGGVRVHDGKKRGGHTSFGIGDLPSRISDEVYGVKNGKFVAINASAIPSPQGPGPTTLLYGDEDLGYFGWLDGLDLFTNRDISFLTGVSLPSLTVGRAQGWLKFAYQGKILYIAQTHVHNAINWGELNDHDLVYGTRSIRFDQHHFSIRLPRGYNADPWDGSGHDLSEWDQLVYRVTADYPDTPERPRWDALTAPDLYPESEGTLCQESRSSLYAVVRGSRTDILNESLAVKTSSNTNGRQGWRPVLELIP